MTGQPLRFRGSTRNPHAVIDVFSGVGGLSLGAARAGFEVLAAIDSDPLCIEAHSANFQDTHHIDKPVETLTGKDLLRDLGLRRGTVDGLIGGPPCQGFSEIGKRKLDDPRNSLFAHFLRLVVEIRPKFFVVENVPGILSPRYKDLLEAAFGALPTCYRVFEPCVVAANKLGAPTSRTRVFFIGIDGQRLPHRTHIGLTNLIGNEVTVGHALTGLPSIRSEWQQEKQSWRRVGDVPMDSYFERVTSAVPSRVGNHVALHHYAKSRLVSGCFGTRHTTSTLRRFDRLRPGQRDPVSKAVRLANDGFCPTIRAGTGAERGSYQAVRPIHPGSPRVITPREAARLQGFPDWFIFHPTKWHAFRQIGNSVSPIVAEALLTKMLGLLRA
jgi:DNA (cytosine-5)-methyltransferase 1